MAPTEVDEAIRRTIERRAHRSAPVSVTGTAPIRPEAAGPEARERRPRVLVAACLALLAVIAGVVLLDIDQEGDGQAVVADGSGEIRQFAPDESELPFPKYYPGQSRGSEGEGAILKPGRPERENLSVARYTVSWNWMDFDQGPSLSHVETRMTWADLSRGDVPVDDGFRHCEVEIDGFLLRAASNDPEVTDEQLQAMVDRMAAQYHEARGEAPPEDDGPPARLTPRPSDLPDMPPTPQLEQQFRETPEHELDWFAPVRRNVDGSFRQDPEGRILEDRGRNAFPVFEMDGTLKGVYVAGLGLVERDVYEDPTFDPEHATADGF